MYPHEQEALFKTLRETYPTWTTEFTSGYVHGAVDGEGRMRPRKDYVRCRDDYSLGYLTGFAVHFGSDCETAAWFSFVGERVHGIVR